VEDSNPKKKQKELLRRLSKASFPPAAVAGALASFAEAALGAPSKDASRSGSGLVQIGLSESGKVPPPVQTKLEIQYSEISKSRPFRRSLRGITIGPGDTIHALGDDEVRIFAPDWSLVRSWKAPDQASCIALDHDGRIYIGVKGRVEVYDPAGIRKAVFEVGGTGKPASITAVKIHFQDILIADAAARCIRRLDLGGKQIGEIGTQNKTRGFMLPNRNLDIDVDSKGLVLATDTGRHQVSFWNLDGAPVRIFGKFGLVNPEDFVGCCNPVNLAFSPDGRIVTAEKVAARVKIYSGDGRLLGLIGPENFDPKCTQMHLAVDSKGQIFVADPVRLEIKVFSALVKSGSRENV
jgi:hypothetical protein